jgi:protein O-GlcNAc transferase
MTIAESFPTEFLAIDQALQQAITHHQAGNLQDAERIYRAIINAVPNHPDANHNLGVLAVQVGQAEAGLPHLKAALEANPRQGQYWLSYIDALIKADQTDNAKQVLQQGRQFGISGDAFDSLERNLQQVPSQVEINVLINEFNAGQYAEAERLALAMTNTYPDVAIGWKVLSATLQQMGRIEDALMPMQKSVQLCPNDTEAYNNLGITFKDLGRLDEAEASYRRALEIKPDFAEAYSNLGITLKDLGRLDEAEASYRRALEIKPDFAEAHSNLGVTLQDLGRLGEAEASYREAIALKPDYAEAHSNLGNTLKELGRLDEAEASYRRAIVLKPDYAVAYNNLGNTVKELGRLDEAEASYRQAIFLKPDFAEAHNNLGNTVKELGRLDEAAASLREAIALKPDYALAHSNLGVTLQDLGCLGEAEASYRQAIALKPDFAEVHSNLGNTLKELGRLGEAEASYREAIALKPDYAEGHSNLGVALKELGRLEEAEASCRQAIALKPDFVEGHSNLGVVLQELGRLDEAEASCRQATTLNPDFPGVRSSLLFILNYVAGRDCAVRLEEARNYGLLVSAQAKERFTAWRCCKKPSRLRVGLVSGDLGNHPVGFFLESILAQLNPASIELRAYPTINRSDDLTDRIRPRFHSWKPLVGLSDEAAARLVHSDGVHILLDLAGHTAHNRLPLFAWKPAPVQATWLGYFATTGLAEMDYLLADEVGVPQTHREHFTETVWYLPDTRLCFSPPDIDLAVADLPALKTGHITFGCFQNRAKIGDEVLAVWGKILNALPCARLRLQSKQLGDQRVVKQFVQSLRHHGIDPTRVSLYGDMSRNSYLAAHAEVDMILDTFPFPGGTTSCEGLWMGVPTLTLLGDRLISRQGASLLMAAGLSEWIAASETDYVAKAIAIAGDLPKLAALRAGLRQQVLASPLLDASRFARHFEEALWGMWRKWCEKS